MTAARSPFRAAAPLLVIAAAGLAVAWPVLSWPMTYDDVHLIRHYTPREIGGAFQGRWDPDDMENPGLRPLYLLFNHARAALFGENVVAHRLFLVGLFATFLALLVRPLARFGLSPAEGVVAGVLCLWSRFSVYHYAFLTDGAHVAQAVCFALALRAVLRGVDGGGGRPLAAAVAWVTVGVLVREDTMAVVPVLVLLAALAARAQGRVALRRVAIVGGVLVLVCAALMAYRALAVPNLPRDRLSLDRLLRTLANALSLTGRESFDPWSRLLVSSTRVLPVLPLLAALAVRGAARWRPLLWLGLTILACSTGLVVTRDNLYVFPVTFMALAVASALGALARMGRAGGVTAAVMLAWMAAGELHLSREFQLVFHPYSATALRWSGEFVYGAYWQATVPPGRREEIVARLASIGIRDEAQFKEKLPRKTYTATVEGPWRPVGDARLFAPRLGFRAFRP
jgi:hypothetical protein